MIRENCKTEPECPEDSTQRKICLKSSICTKVSGINYHQYYNFNKLKEKKMNPKLIEIVANTAGVDETDLTEGSFLGEEELGLDSLDMVQLVMDLEDEFDISITDIEAQQWRTVGDIEDFIKKS